MLSPPKNYRRWSRVVAFANADEQNPTATFVSMLDSFGLVPELGDLPARSHPDLAKEARKYQPRLRIVLSHLSGDLTFTSEAQAILGDYQTSASDRRRRWTDWPALLLPVRLETISNHKLIAGKGIREFFDRVKTYQEAIPGRGIRMKVNLIRSPQPVRAYRNVLDAVCEFVIDALKDGVLPVRRCYCSKFFLRHGRRLYCSMRCYKKRWRPSRDAKRDVENIRLARKLTVKQLRARIAQVKRRKTAPTKKRRLLSTFRKVLRDRLQ